MDDYEFSLKYGSFYACGYEFIRFVSNDHRVSLKSTILLVCCEISG